MNSLSNIVRSVAHAMLPVILAVGPLMVFGCGGSSPRSSATNDEASGSARGDRFTIVTTTAMLADAVRAITGEHADVTSLMGEGVDPHLYRPTRSDMTALLRADLVIVNGLHLEGQMSEAFEQLRRAGRRVHAVAEHLARLDSTPVAVRDDPHIWMSPALWSHMLEHLTRELARERPPEVGEAFQRNAEAYRRELNEFDAWAAARLATIPETHRVLLTAHDAFGYFGQAYGIEVIGVQGLSTESEAGVFEIRELQRMLVERKIPAIFAETSVGDQYIQSLMAGAKAAGHAVRLGGHLYSDAMGATGTYEGTYIGMMDHNVTTITRALGGDAPPRGMNGRLSSDIHP